MLFRSTVGARRKRASPYVCERSPSPSHPSCSLLSPRWSSVWCAVSLQGSRGSVAPVAGSAALPEQRGAASSRPEQPVRHVPCKSHTFALLPGHMVAVHSCGGFTEKLTHSFFVSRMCCLCLISLLTSTTRILKSPSILLSTSDPANNFSNLHTSVSVCLFFTLSFLA